MSEVTVGCTFPHTNDPAHATEVPNAGPGCTAANAPHRILNHLTVPYSH